MKFSLIICTYMRPRPLLSLLQSVQEQTLYPSQILVIDGSVDEDTKKMLEEHTFAALEYYQVLQKDRGLTRQRNFGINKVAATCEIVCFLDDDTLLTPTYFEALLATYKKFPEALGAGGYIINEVNWKPLAEGENVSVKQFAYDGWVRKDGSRFILRKKLGLDANRPPAHLPEFSHGRSVSFLPPSGKIYPVEQFMGGVASYRTHVLQKHRFSEYFEGYGLYEDADFTLRLSKTGKLYVNTAAQLYHYHEAFGRPDTFAYGKMVIRNGWYVWRAKYPQPGFTARCKWHATSLLLTLIRFSNAVKGSGKKEAWKEALGRVAGWWSLIFNKPKVP